MAEETTARPKPMAEIGGRPILWHILMHYAAHGFADITVATGHLGGIIHDWIAGGPARTGLPPHLRLRARDTGADTNTGGRLRALAPDLDGAPFLLTWGDGLSDVDLRALVAFHHAHGRLATVTAVRPPPRFGHLDLEGDRVARFREKPPRAEGWINGAFFVLDPAVLDRVDGPDTLFEGSPLQSLARDGELMAFRHEGFWRCMDTPRDRAALNRIWDSGQAPWQTWPADAAPVPAPQIQEGPTCMSS